MPDDRLHLLFGAIYNENEHERAAAAFALYRHLVSNKIHPRDVALLVGTDNLIERNIRVIDNLEREITRLGRENLFFRQHTHAALLRQAEAAGKVDPIPWFALHDLMAEKWSADGTTLPTNWRRLLREAVGASEGDIRRWEAGLSSVPDEVVNKLHSHRPAVAKKEQEGNNPESEVRALRQQLKQMQRQYAQMQRQLEKEKAQPRAKSKVTPVQTDEPAPSRKQRSYKTLDQQNKLLLLLLSRINPALSTSMLHPEMAAIATKIWGGSWRRPLANLFHLSTVNINNTMPSKPSGTIYNKVPAYFFVLRFVHDLIAHHGWKKEDFMLTESDSNDIEVESDC